MVHILQRGSGLSLLALGETVLLHLLPCRVSVLDTHSCPSPAVGGLQSVELLFPIHFQTFSLLMLAEIQAVGKAICIKERGSLFKAVILIHRSKIMILLSHCFMESICLFTTLAALGT